MRRRGAGLSGGRPLSDGPETPTRVSSGLTARRGSDGEEGEGRGRPGRVDPAEGRRGIRTGRVVGATDRLGEDVTDRLGEDVTDRRVGPQDFLATVYRHLGIDYETVTLPDFGGRPVPIVQGGRAIPELVAS